jgi:hypothetical protein
MFALTYVKLVSAATCSAVAAVAAVAAVLVLYCSRASTHTALAAAHATRLPCMFLPLSRVV